MRAWDVSNGNARCLPAVIILSRSWDCCAHCFVRWASPEHPLVASALSIHTYTYIPCLYTFVQGPLGPQVVSRWIEVGFVVGSKVREVPFQVPANFISRVGRLCGSRPNLQVPSWDHR
jgi:hypothetical protein